MNDSHLTPTRRPMAFLQTALLVDDRAFADRDPAAEEPSTRQVVGLHTPSEEILETPPEEALHGDLDDNKALPAPSPPAAELKPDDDDIDPKLLIEGFAELGIACATLAPRRTSGQDRTRVLALAANADIVILDWMLRAPGEQEGDTQNQLHVNATTSRDLVRDIAEADEARGGRLRLLCIYTGSKELIDITNQVADALEEIHGPAVQRHLADLTITAPHLRVVLLAKKSNRAPDADPVPEDMLAGHLVEEFATFADGLLRAVALAELAAVRNNAHRLLLRFPNSLDAPFLSHRALVGLSDADEWATQLITDEIAAVAAGPGKAGEFLDREGVQQVIDRLIPSAAEGRKMYSKPSGTRTRPVSTDVARRLFEVGKADTEFADNATAEAVGKAASVTLLLMDPAQEPYAELAMAQDDELAVVSCLARDPRHEGPRQHQPILTLGSLVQAMGTYYLCVQPLCDTVRLGGPTVFPLLPLEVAQNDQSFDLTVPVSATEQLIRLRSTNGRLRDLQLHRFQPDGGVVKAEYQPGPNTAGRWLFRSYGEPLQAAAKCDAEIQHADQPAAEYAEKLRGTSLEFTWAGEVRAGQAARCALRLSQSASRPGLLEFGYQRVRSGL